MYQNTTLKKHVDLLLIGEWGESHYALIKDFNTFMNDQTLHLRRKHFRCYYYKLSLLKRHTKDCFKINVKQIINIPKKGKYVKFKNFKRKIKSPFMTYLDLQSILLPKDNEKRSPEEPYMSKYKKHVACSYGYK